jgi:hypothetical protein
MEKIKDNENQYFECDCYGRDHLLIVRKRLWRHSVKDEGEKKADIHICIDFVANRGCYDVNILRGYKFFGIENFVRRLWWRLSEAIKVLINGEYKVYDCWIPCRTEKDEELELVGVDETIRLGETLIRFAKEAKDYYDNSCEENKIV